jgi:hypothetical protein
METRIKAVILAAAVMVVVIAAVGLVWGWFLSRSAGGIGGGRDGHGCLIAAGYSWNITSGECMRQWSGELQCDGCPLLSPVRPGWCENGTITPGDADECGCAGPPKCIMDESNMGYLEGDVSIGPICPVERIPPDPKCMPTAETYKAHALSVYAVGSDGSRLKVMVFYADASGHYKIPLRPGVYEIQTERTAGLGSLRPVNVTISAGGGTRLDIRIDTGIR